MSLKKIDANLSRIGAAGEKLNVLIHMTAMLIAVHAAKSGDCTRALALVKAMPASMRRTTLIQWFTKHSPIRIVFQNDAVGMLKKGDKGYTAFDLDKAEANPFHKIAEKNTEAGLLDFDKFVKMIQGMAKREAAKADEGKVKLEDVASIKAACDVLSGLKFARIEPANDSGQKDDADAGFGPMALAAVA